MSLETGCMLFIWGISIALTLYSTWLTIRHFLAFRSNIRTKARQVNPLPPISILKPLKGIENEIEINLRTFFQLDYPEFEIIFSVAEERDEVCQIVRQLISEFPRVPAQLIIGAVHIGPNPKINNLIRSYNKAKHGWILISDSNVRVQADYLTQLACHLENDVGLITAVVEGSAPKKMGGHLERIFLNTFYARAMILAESFGRPCVVGKCMLFQKKVANRFGGIQILARYLAEDFMAGEAMRRLGLRVVIASSPVKQHIGSYSIFSFWSRHLRWGRIRKSQAPLIFFIEPVLGSIISGLIGSIAFHHFWGYSAATVFVIHISIWLICDMMVVKSLGQDLKLLDPLFWLFREVLSFPLWICIAAGNTVHWRGRQFTLQTGGILEGAQQNRG